MQDPSTLKLQTSSINQGPILCECILNAPTVSLILLAFDDTGSLGYPSRRVDYRPSVSTLVTASRFLTGNRERYSALSDLERR